MYEQDQEVIESNGQQQIEDQEFNFDLSQPLGTFPVKIKMPDGSVKNCHIKEMMGDERDKWLTEQTRRSKKNSRGIPVGIANLEGFQADLIWFCLFDEEGRRPFHKEQIRKWPARMQSRLYKKASEMSGLDELAEDRAKND